MIGAERLGRQGCSCGPGGEEESPGKRSSVHHGLGFASRSAESGNTLLLKTLRFQRVVTLERNVSEITSLIFNRWIKDVRSL